MYIFEYQQETWYVNKRRHEVYNSPTYARAYLLYFGLIRATVVELSIPATVSTKFIKWVFRKYRIFDIGFWIAIKSMVYWLQKTWRPTKTKLRYLIIIFEMHVKWCELKCNPLRQIILVFQRLAWKIHYFQSFKWPATCNRSTNNIFFIGDVVKFIFPNAIG